MDSKKNQTSAVSMTEGSLWKNIFLFSCPLIFSQLLEVMFNLSDVAVVGRFADYRALGSVGSTSLLVTLFTGFLIGMGAGVNVRVAHGLGAGNQKETEETIHSSFLICLVTGLLICVVGLTSSRAFLVLLHTKDELMEGAVNYLQIYSHVKYKGRTAGWCRELFADLFPWYACAGTLQFRQRRYECPR